MVRKKQLEKQHQGWIDIFRGQGPSENQQGLERKNGERGGQNNIDYLADKTPADLIV